MYRARRPLVTVWLTLTRQSIAVEWARPELKEAAQKWLDTMADGAANKTASADYIKALESSIATVDELASIEKFKAHAEELKAKGEKFCDCDACKLVAAILKDKEYLEKKSIHLYGDFGWPMTSASAA